MSLLRFAGRVLYSSYFVVDGYQSFVQPDKYVAEVAPTINNLVPKAKSFLPEQVADKVPEDTKTWVRILGLTQIIGGVGFATGLMRRPGAILLALASVPHVAASLPGADGSEQSKRHSQGNLLRNLSLLGAASLVAQDTEGKPSLYWRARYGSQQIAAAADRGKDALGRTVETTKKLTKAQAKVAKANLEAGASQAELAATKGFFKARGKVKDALN